MLLSFTPKELQILITILPILGRFNWNAPRMGSILKPTSQSRRLNLHQEDTESETQVQDRGDDSGFFT